MEINDPLTKDRRYEICIHEAGHAVVHALGGAGVYRVAVAPEGATSWVHETSRGNVCADLLGICETSNLSPLVWLSLRWDGEDMNYVADRKGFNSSLRQFGAQNRAMGREFRRQIRSEIVGCLAGPAAEQLYRGEEVYLEGGNWFSRNDDITKASALSRLLPWRNEFDHLAQLTESVLRRPEVWVMVVALANELERVGVIEDVSAFLPKGVPDWPPSTRAKTPPPFTLCAEPLLPSDVAA